MANNRLYIRCKNCNQYAYISKNFGGPYGLNKDEVKRLNEFFESHAYCMKDDEDVQLAHGGWFELLDEYNDGFPYYTQEGEKE